MRKDRVGEESCPILEDFPLCAFSASDFPLSAMWVILPIRCRYQDASPPLLNARLSELNGVLVRDPMVVHTRHHPGICQ